MDLASGGNFSSVLACKVACRQLTTLPKPTCSYSVQENFFGPLAWALVRFFVGRHRGRVQSCLEGERPRGSCTAITQVVVKVVVPFWDSDRIVL